MDVQGVFDVVEKKLSTKDNDISSLLWEFPYKTTGEMEYLQLCFSRPLPEVDNVIQKDRAFVISQPKLDSFGLSKSLQKDEVISNCKNINMDQKNESKEEGNSNSKQNHKNKSQIRNSAELVKEYLIKGTLPNTITFKGAISTLKSLQLQDWSDLWSEGEPFYNFHYPTSRNQSNPALFLLVKQVNSENLYQFLNENLKTELEQFYSNNGQLNSFLQKLTSK